MLFHILIYLIQLKNYINYENNKKDIICAVDGTYNNTNDNRKTETLQTSLCMGYYDVTNSVPIDITYNGTKNKNNEFLI